MAIDSEGTVHAVYEAVGGGVRYANNEGGAWSRETVDQVGAYGAVAVDAEGMVQVGYIDLASATLRYATRRGGEWYVEDVAVPAHRAWLAIGGDGTRHVFFLGPRLTRGYLLRHAVRVEGGWAVDDVVANSDALDRPDIAVTSNGVPHAVYAWLDIGEHYDSWGLVHLARDAGAWEELGARSFRFPKLVWPQHPSVAMAVDAVDVAHIAYLDTTGAYLRYASSATPNLPDEHIDRTGGEVWALALDNAGAAYVLYEQLDSYDPSDVSYHEAALATNKSGRWVCTSAVKLDYRSAGYALALDPEDRPHVAYVLTTYWEALEGQLRLAVGTRE